MGGYRNELAYYIALCHYVLKQYVPSLKMLAEIVERGIKEHPGTLFLCCSLLWINLPRTQRWRRQGGRRVQKRDRLADAS